MPHQCQIDRLTGTEIGETIRCKDPAALARPNPPEDHAVGAACVFTYIFERYLYALFFQSNNRSTVKSPGRSGNSLAGSAPKPGASGIAFNSRPTTCKYRWTAVVFSAALGSWITLVWLPGAIPKWLALDGFSSALQRFLYAVACLPVFIVLVQTAITVQVAKAVARILAGNGQFEVPYAALFIHAIFRCLCQLTETGIVQLLHDQLTGAFSEYV